MTTTTSTFPHPDDFDRLTPTMRQFMDIKVNYMDALVLFRLGDFYETFFDDAVRIHRLIGVTLTKRGKDPQGEMIPMAGVPAVSLEQYLERLVKLGVSVVIAEQEGTPSSKQVMHRRISRIITPGTLTDANLLPEKMDTTLVALTEKRGMWGVASVVLTQGRVVTQTVSDSDLVHELARLNPNEVLIDENKASDFRARFPECVVTGLPPWHFDGARGKDAICQHFGLTHLRAWDLEDEPLILASCNAMLDYLKTTQVDAVPYLQPFIRYHAQETIAMDAASRRHLEITSHLRADKPSPTLWSTLDHAETSAGSRTLRRWLDAPTRDRQVAQSRQNAITTLLAHEDVREALHTLFKALPDIERLASRLALGSIRPKELACCRDAIPTLEAIRQVVGALGWTDRQEALSVPQAFYQILQDSLLEEPSTFLRDGMVMRDEVSPELSKWRHFQQNAQGLIETLETNEREKSQLPGLRIEYNKVSGYYIELPRGQAQSAPTHFIRTQTLKHVERFTTPELKQFEQEAVLAQDKALALEKELFEELLRSLLGYVPTLIEVARHVGEMDALLSLAEHAHAWHWVAPTLSERVELDIEGARHAVIETVLEDYTPNDCSLHDGRRALVITGPNMGGKSTYMRSIALIALLAWVGSYVPATRAVIGPIDRIHTRIGASDDLTKGQSTFMVEMTEAAHILHHATQESLILMDEIGRGTSTFDGLSLAGAILEELVANTRALTLFATHYFELTSVVGRLKEAANVHVSAIQNKGHICFMHRLEEGPASHSYGIAVAQLAGIPARVIKRAKSLMQELEALQNAQSTPQAQLFNWEPSLESPIEEPLDTRAIEEATLAPVKAWFDEIDVDNLTPRDALDVLYKLKARIRTL